MAKRSTVLRLERQQSVDHSHAIAALQQSYVDLAEGVLHAARLREYFGQDPFAGLEYLGEAPQVSGDLLHRVAQLWECFFESFREDEQAHEGARFQQEAAEIQAELDEVPPGAVPDEDLVRRMLAALLQFWSERQRAVSERLDLLINDLNAKQAELGSAELQRAHLDDETQRARQVVQHALAELGASLGEDSRFVDEMERILGLYRKAISKLKSERDRQRERGEALAAHLASCFNEHADTGELPAIQAVADRSLIRAVQQACYDREELEGVQQDLLAQVAQAESHARKVEEELQERDERLARYEFHDTTVLDEDQRLPLYREAVAKLQDGQDAAAVLEQIREMEEVLSLGAEDERTVLQHLDLHRENLIRLLGQLRKAQPLTDDPRRFRGRLLGASPYQIKTIPGQMRALRDIGRDVLVYVDQLAWVRGVEILVRELKRLKPIFAEMVQLVADCREQLGGPEPSSSTISLQLTSGLAALPAILVTDIDALLRSRGSAKMASHIQPVFAETVDLVHGMVEKACAHRIEREPVPKRESARKAIGRLSKDLMRCTGLWEHTFREAADVEYQLGEQECVLIHHEADLQLALGEVDRSCDVLAGIEGAPAIDGFPRVPTGKHCDVFKLLEAGKVRVRWLEALARYRVVVV